MIIWGENDSLIPIHHYHQFLRDLPKAKILLISNCGHMPQEEKPEEVLSGMLPFFKEVEETN